MLVDRHVDWPNPAGAAVQGDVDAEGQESHAVSLTGFRTTLIEFKVHEFSS